MVNAQNLKNNHICHTIISQYIIYNNADTIQEQLDEQEHIWNTSGHIVGTNMGVNYTLLDGQLIWNLYIHKWASTIIKGQISRSNL